MPNIKSAIKRVKVTEKKALRNKMLKSSLRTQVKKFNVAVEAKDQQAAQTLLPVTSSAVDHAVSKGVMHRNTANRKKSRLAKQLNRMQG